MFGHSQGVCASQEHFLCLPYGGVLMVGSQGVRASQESFLCLLMEEF